MHNRPIYKFITQMNQETTRFFMPGHKGHLPDIFREIAPFDITEIKGADDLYHSHEIIRQSEDLARDYFCTKDTLFSVQGSSQCIFAMIFFAHMNQRTLGIERNCHISVLKSLSLLDIPYTFIQNQFSSSTGLPTPLTLSQIKNHYKVSPFSALFLQGVDYYGQVPKLTEIIAFCKAHSILLLVDNAHGAPLYFLDTPSHPITLGVDLCCDSLHKTLPAMTGTGLLHSNLPDARDLLKEGMSRVGSTSPSYPLLLSIEFCIFQLSSWDMKQKTKELENKIKISQEVAKKQGLFVLEIDPFLRLCLSPLPLGVTGEVLGDFLRSYHIEPELVTSDFVVLLPSYSNIDSDFVHLNQALADFSLQTRGKSPLPFSFFTFPLGKLEKTIFYAMNRPRKKVSLSQGVQEIMGEILYQFPPGIPIAIPGQRVTKDMIKILENCGIQEIKVVK